MFCDVKAVSQTRLKHWQYEARDKGKSAASPGRRPSSFYLFNLCLQHFACQQEKAVPKIQKFGRSIGRNCCLRCFVTRNSKICLIERTLAA